MLKLIFILLFFVTSVHAGISKKLTDLLVKYEGYSETVYMVEGRPHIGIGHLLTKEELKNKEVIIDQIKFSLNKPFSHYTIMRLLEQDMDFINRIIKRHIKVDLKDNQKIAIQSYLYNVGYQGLFLREDNKISFKRKTKFLKYLNNKEFDKAKNQIDINTSNGKFLIGLQKRRQEEQNIFGE